MWTIFDKASAPAAPDGEVQAPDGLTVTLSELWSQASLTALAFTRHFG